MTRQDQDNVIAAVLALTGGVAVALATGEWGLGVAFTILLIFIERTNP